MIGLFPAAEAEGVNIYTEFHRYQPSLRTCLQFRLQAVSVQSAEGGAANVLTIDSTISTAPHTAASTVSLSPIRPSSGPNVAGSQPTSKTRFNPALIDCARLRARIEFIA